MLLRRRKTARPRFLVLRGRWLAMAGAAAAAAAIFCVVNWPYAVGASATQRQLPIYCVQREQKVLAISFDAAWGNEDTQQIIDILARYQVPATFFVVGQWAEKYPESVRALHEAGHQVMNHSNAHGHYPQMSAQEVTDDLNACNDKIEAVTGVRPTLIRLPYGDYDDRSIAAIRAAGMEPIQWNVDSLDWKEIPAREIVTRVTEKVQPGSIVLFHNAAKHTPEALPTILEMLLREGYTFLPISQLILPGQYGQDYTIDHTGRQCPVQT